MATELKVVFPERQKAVLLEEELPDEIPADHVMGKTLVSLVSPGTELHWAYLGDSFPIAPGYAAIFVVEQVGSDVTDIKPGDTVYCTGPHGIGGHRSHQCCPRIACIPVPEDLDPAVAVHARLMSVSMTTLTTTTSRPPCPILVTGLGPIGHLAAQIWTSCGYQVTGVDLIESRRQLAKSKGVYEVLDHVPIDREGPFDRFALAIDCSGHEQAVLDCCKAVRKGGEVAMIGGQWKQYTDISAHEIFKAVYRGFVTLRSGWEWEIARHPMEFRNNSCFTNMAGALQWLAEGRIDTAGLYITRKPEEAVTIYDELLDRKIDALSVLFDWR